LLRVFGASLARWAPHAVAEIARFCHKHLGKEQSRGASPAPDNRMRPETSVMTIDQAKSFVQKHGVVLASGKGPVPRLAEAVVSEPITGSWWSHPKAQEIFT